MLSEQEIVDRIFNDYKNNIIMRQDINKQVEDLPIEEFENDNDDFSDIKFKGYSEEDESELAEMESKE